MSLGGQKLVYVLVQDKKHWLSFEHGIQNPDPRSFELALEALGVDTGETIMVGDSRNNVGGAAAVGITTNILPAL